MANPDIPEELVREIFIKLSVKSILTCKCVCKTWLSIISNPCFTKLQLEHAIVNPVLLNIKKGAKKSFKAEVKEELFDKLDSSFVPIRSRIMPSMFNHNITPIISSCNGIVFVESRSSSHNDDFFLWNPSIRQYKKLPFPGLSDNTVGFGHDSISDDYKVIRLVYQIQYDLIFRIAQVYSSNADSWRQFTNPVLKRLKDRDRHCIVANGVLYFGNDNELISFDLHKEVLGLVSLPSFDESKRRSDVMDFQGSVAVFFESGLGIIDLWTLDGVSCHSSPWSKRFSLQTCSEIWIHFYQGAQQFYGSRSANSATGFLYNYKSKEMRYNGLVAKKTYATLKYSETLVSLIGFKQVESNAQIIS